MPDVIVQIENAYSDGHESTHTVEIPGPDPDETVEAWFDCVVYQHTGDGHGIDNDLGTCYTATVIGPKDSPLMGETYEWVSS